jgi:Zinc knuckle
MKLDPKRYMRMLSEMRKDALRKDADAYPKTLASAYRIASGWSNEEAGGGSHSMDSHSAYLADTVFVTKAKDSEKGGKMAGSKGKKSGDIICFVCGIVGHYARDCEKRKGAEKALVTTAAHEDEKEENCDKWDVALFTSNECVLFTEHEILLDNEASINIFRDKNLLTGVRDAGRKVLLGGIQRSASGVKVTQEGEFSDVGTVYFSDSASANILSLASQIDAGADISYDRRADTFVMTPAGGRNTYLFGRKQANGSEGRLYTCDIRTMIVPREQAFVQTMEDNMRHSASEKSQGDAGQDGISLGGTSNQDDKQWE